MLLRWWLAIALLLAVPPLVAAQEQRVALVIGNAAYPVGPLRNSVNDSRAMAKALRDNGFTVIERQNQTRRQMLAALREFGANLTPDTVGVFYYAGHGIQSQGTNYLIPIDAQFESEAAIDEESVNVNAVLGRIQEGRARLAIVILDACRDNPFERRFRSLGRGLAQQDAPAGSMIAFATSPGSTAADGAGANGLYTEELLAAMQLPGLKVEELFKRVRIEVQKRSNGRQVPWENTSLTGEFYFRPLAPTARAEAAPGTGVATAGSNPYELLFWQTIMNSDRPTDFEEYLRRFPQGVFAGLAKDRAAALRQVDSGSRDDAARKETAAKDNGRPAGNAPKVAATPIPPTPPALSPVPATAPAKTTPPASTAEPEQPQQFARIPAPQSFRRSDVQGRWVGDYNALELRAEISGSRFRGTVTCYSDKYLLQGEIDEAGNISGWVGGVGGGMIRVNGVLPILTVEFYVSPSGVAICQSGKLNMVRQP